MASRKRQDGRARSGSAKETKGVSMRIGPYVAAPVDGSACAFAGSVDDAPGDERQMVFGVVAPETEVRAWLRTTKRHGSDPGVWVCDVLNQEADIILDTSPGLPPDEFDELIEQLNDELSSVVLSAEVPQEECRIPFEVIIDHGDLMYDPGKEIQWALENLVNDISGYYEEQATTEARRRAKADPNRLALVTKRESYAIRAQATAPRNEHGEPPTGRDETFADRLDLDDMDKGDDEDIDGADTEKGNG